MENKNIYYDTVISELDGLRLYIAVCKPENEPKAVIQLAHGMTEHKERYFDFMKFLSSAGYICVISDHRGHGKSVKSDGDLGYFYTKDFNSLSEDMYSVTKYIKSSFPDLPVFMFAHSMGTLAARNYIKNYDFEIKKLVLTGPPTKNFFAPPGYFLSRFLSVFGDKRRSRFLYAISTKAFNKGFKTPNSWINSDGAEVEKYNADRLCSYIFTVNGYINLLGMLNSAFRLKDYKTKNPGLEIFLAAGEKDPVIGSEKKLFSLEKFLIKAGYENIRLKIYKNMRHEIINEKEKAKVYKDILNFYEGKKGDKNGN